MNNLIYSNPNFYIALVNLLYAIANKFLSQEKKKVISNILYQNDNLDLKEYQCLIDQILHELINKNVDSQKAFSVFSEFFFKNRKTIDNSTIIMINEFCNSILLEKDQRSKSGLILLKKLNSMIYSN